MAGRSLDELLTIFAAEDPERAYLDETLRTAATRDPELPRVLRAGAIPRALDAEIVGVLRRALPADPAPGPDDGGVRSADDARLLGLVRELRFVSTAPDGRLVYHDATRDALLADWRRTPEGAAELDRLNRSLAEHHERRYRECQRHADVLGELTPLIGRANPPRLQRLIDTLDGSLGAALLDALYHRLQVDVDDGFEFFRTEFGTLEDRERLVVCRSVVAATRDFLLRLPSGFENATRTAWLDYFDARLQRQSPEFDPGEAAVTLRTLLERTDLPGDLRRWALNDLAQVHEGQLELTEALQVRLELVAMEPGHDVYNEPLWHHSLAGLRVWMGEDLAAVPHLKEAVEQADALTGARQDIRAFARLDLAGLFAELGDWAEAFERATEALTIARTELRHDAVVQRAVATRFADLLSRFDVRASDCAAVEASQLPPVSAVQSFRALGEQLSRLLDVGRVQTARALLDGFTASPVTDPIAQLQVDVQAARVLRCEGRESDAEAAYSALVTATAGRARMRWLHIEALISRGETRSTLGRYDDAAADLQEARRLWSARGCPVRAAGVGLSVVAVQARQGQPAAALQELGKVGVSLPPGSNRFRTALDYHLGEVHILLGNWDAAHEALTSVLAASSLRRLGVEAVTALSRLTETQAMREAWASLATCAQDLATRSAALADTDRPAHPEADRATNLNADGIARYCRPDGGAAELDRARQLFRAAAEEAPDNPWPALNQSYAHAAQEDWASAAAALQTALDRCPPLMRTSALLTLLRDYTMRNAAQLARTQADGPADVLTDLLDGPVGRLRPEQLAGVHALRHALLVVAGDVDAAHSAFRTAVHTVDQDATRAGAWLGPEVAAQVTTVAQYWAADDLLAPLEADIDPVVAQAAAATRRRLAERLDELLGLHPDPAADEPEIPVLAATIVEVGDDLVPIVDSRVDGGRFLFELLPEMRERIRASRGVHVPGLRMRGSYDLGSTEFRVRIQEIPVATGQVAPDGTFVVLPAGEHPRDRRELTDAHPSTGRPGLWVIRRSSGSTPDGSVVLDGAQLLVHHIEQVIRTHLARYVGLATSGDLVAEWRAADRSGLVDAVVVDDEALAKLTWLLHDLVEDGVDVSDWSTLLAAVRDTGGLSAPREALTAAVRARLGPALPGPWTGRTAVAVPDELQDALAGADAGDHPAGLDFRRWLRETRARSGPALTLVVRDHPMRVVVAAAARAEDRLITVLTGEEVGP